MNRYFIPLTAAAVLTVTYSEAAAQRVPSYLRTPTVSPYVNLFRGDAGGLSNYFTLVRPQQRQIMFNQNQMVENRLMEQQLRYNDQQLMQMPMAQQIMAAGGISMRPGTQTLQAPMPAASYFNYSHYYGVPVTGAGVSSARGIRTVGSGGMIVGGGLFGRGGLQGGIGPAYSGAR